MITIDGKYCSADVYVAGYDKLDSASYGQIVQLLSVPCMKGSKIAIMPDVHAGVGCVVGYTQTVTDTIVPNLVGVDVACGMLVCKVSQDYNFNYERLDKLIRLNIPSGMNHRKTLHKFAKNVDLSGLIADTDRNKLLYSVGSLGGGNHFIEVDVDEAGDHYIVIHSGSRYLGQVVCKFHQQRAIDRYLRNRKETGDETQYPSNLAWLEGSDTDDYLNDMNLCADFSYWSRKAMLQEILDGMDIKRRYIMEEFTTLHNYVDVDNKIIRKGSISLQDGERAIIPMNMRDGSLIVTGKGNAAANFSGPHGAGRVLSRGDAKAKLSMEDFKAAMEGIYSTSVRTSTIDESPMAYKPVQAILDNIGDLCTVDTVIKPEYNFKAS
jgi:RNA-splicing ligase RtcB